jgi:transcription initiation factor IIE alpha subunit
MAGGLHLTAIMSRESVLEVLPSSESDAMSLKEIAIAIDMDTTTYADRIRSSRNLARILRILIKWGWVSCARRQRTDGNKVWYNVYWKTEHAAQHPMTTGQKLQHWQMQLHDAE